jgi:hypothetical protein
LLGRLSLFRHANVLAPRTEFESITIRSILDVQWNLAAYRLKPIRLRIMSVISTCSTIINTGRIIRILWGSSYVAIHHACPTPRFSLSCLLNDMQVRGNSMLYNWRSEWRTSSVALSHMYLCGAIFTHVGRDKSKAFFVTSCPMRNLLTNNARP